MEETAEMTRKELIEKIVYYTIPYCNNCRYVMGDECCEGCHRKYMMWELHDDVADGIINLVKESGV